MNVVKSMMEGMMPVMMKGLTPEEKERLMLDMMPMMMEGLDLGAMLPKMMSTMLPAMLPELLAFLAREGAGARMLQILATVMPTVCEVIDKPKLAEKKDALLAELMAHDTFRERMPACFTDGFPYIFAGFVDQFCPAIPADKRTEFITRMVTSLTCNLSSEEKEAVYEALRTS